MRKAYFPVAKSPSKSQVFWWNPLEMKPGGGAECAGCHRTSSGRSCGQMWRFGDHGAGGYGYICIYIDCVYIYIYLL